MGVRAKLKACYVPSENVVAREIEGELIIVPLVSGIGDMDDELFTLNEQGKAVWRLLGHNRTLQDIAEELSREYEAAAGEIQRDVLGFAGELLRRKMLVECPRL